jgi:hypothetical protein
MNPSPITATNRRSYTIFFLSLFVLLCGVITLGGYKVVFYSGPPAREETAAPQKARESQEKKIVSPVPGQ